MRLERLEERIPGRPPDRLASSGADLQARMDEGGIADGTVADAPVLGGDGANVEAQTIQVGQNFENLTVVPGYSMHAGAVGVEGFVPMLIAGNRLEIEALGDFLPLTYYEEKPDNPGAVTVGFGWNAMLAVRYGLLGGVFIEGRGYTTGASVDTRSPSRSRMTMTPCVARPERLTSSTDMRITVPPSEMSITA